MPNVKVHVESPVDADSFRVQQIAGMFDVSLAKKMGESFDVEVPAADEDWTIGVIVGPSGSGKSTIAREAFGKNLYLGGRWPKDKAFVDGFPESLEMRTITQTLTSVGFASTPKWVRPYHVLSNGEKFRADLARALLASQKLVAFDEFTSVVDRTVAKIGSAAVAKTLRAGRVGDKKFVAITCHYDIVDWLEPDWVLDMARGQLARGCLRRRPEVELKIYHARRSSWELFKKTHYLDAGLSSATTCYVGFIDRQPAAFVGIGSHFGKKNARDDRIIKRVSRLVVLPDYQGIGIGRAMLDEVARLVWEKGCRVVVTAGHPAMIGLVKSSKNWRATSVHKTGQPARTMHAARRNGRTDENRFRGTRGRAVISAEFAPQE